MLRTIIVDDNAQKKTDTCSIINGTSVLCLSLYIYRESIARQRTEAKIETHASLKARVGSSSNNP